MKKFYGLYILLVVVMGTLLAACGDTGPVSIASANLGTGYDSGSKQVTGATSTIDKSAPEIHIVAKVQNVSSDTTVKAVLTGVDITDANAGEVKDTKLAEQSGTVSSDATADIKFTAPTSGVWPVGSYKIDLYLNDKLDRTVNFTIQ